MTLVGLARSVYLLHQVVKILGMNQLRKLDEQLRERLIFGLINHIFQCNWCNQQGYEIAGSQ